MNLTGHESARVRSNSGAKIVNFIKQLSWLLITLNVIAVACKKDTAGSASSSVQALDATKLRPAFSSAPSEVKAVVDNVMMSIQGSDLVTARSELDKLSKMSGLTDAQKAVVKNLSDQVDKKIAATANSAAPAQ